MRNFITAQERSELFKNLWFATLPLNLREEIVERSYVKRFRDGELVLARGDPVDSWCACAHGAIKHCSTSNSGTRIIVEFVESGSWFTDTGFPDYERRMYDAYAVGSATVIYLRRESWEYLSAKNIDFREGILRLQSGRLSTLDAIQEGPRPKKLSALLVWLLLHLARSSGIESLDDPLDVHVTREACEDLHRLAGESRSAVESELETMKVAGLLRVEGRGISINRRALVDALPIER